MFAVSDLRAVELRASTKSVEVREFKQKLRSEIGLGFRLRSIGEIIKTMLSQEFELGSYTGQLEDGVPHGMGQMVYKETDALEREIYDGHWEGGSQSGQGSMKFRSGEIYSGCFLENLPHGRGNTP